MKLGCWIQCSPNPNTETVMLFVEATMHRRYRKTRRVTLLLEALSMSLGRSASRPPIPTANECPKDVITQEWRLVSVVYVI